VYLIDEPYANSPERNVSAADLQAATNQVRAAFPGKLLMLNLDAASVWSDRRAIPAEIDLVGFDQYCAAESQLRATLGMLKSRLTPYQRLFLMPESAPGRSWCQGKTSDADIAGAQDAYMRIAAGDPRVAYLMNFGWWLGTNADNGGVGTLGEHDPFTNLPLTAAKQQAIGQSVAGFPRLADDRNSRDAGQWPPTRPPRRSRGPFDLQGTVRIGPATGRDLDLSLPARTIST